MRVKRGFAGRRRHKSVLKLAKGYRGRRKNCFKLAKRAVQKGLTHSYAARKAKKRDFRTLWISRINAGVRLHGLSYSKFMAGLKAASIDMDRKVLADLAVREPEAFRSIAERAREALAA